MSLKEGKDYIYLIWKEPKRRKNYIVGQLSKNGQFEFTYGFEVKEAIKQGFNLLLSFDNIDGSYKNDILFPSFSSRLPDRKRKGIDEILSKYGLDEYDAYKLLKRSGAKLPIDNLEFIDPILDEEENNIRRIFCVAGQRHYIGCYGVECSNSIELHVGDNLKLMLESANKYDKNAIKIMTEDNLEIGYVPRYYSNGITSLIKLGYIYSCSVYEIQKDKDCNECIKVILDLNK